MIVLRRQDSPEHDPQDDLTPTSGQFSARYGACPKNETCAFSEGLTNHCTGAGGVGYEKILDWPPWKEPLPTRAWLTTP